MESHTYIDLRNILYTYAILLACQQKRAARQTVTIFLRNEQLPQPTPISTPHLALFQLFGF